MADNEPSAGPVGPTWPARLNLTAEELALINAALLREQGHLQELLNNASGLGEGLAGEVGKLINVACEARVKIQDALRAASHTYR